MLSVLVSEPYSKAFAALFLVLVVVLILGIVMAFCWYVGRVKWKVKVSVAHSGVPDLSPTATATVPTGPTVAAATATGTTSSSSSTSAAAATRNMTSPSVSSSATSSESFEGPTVGRHDSRESGALGPRCAKTAKKIYVYAPTRGSAYHLPGCNIVLSSSKYLKACSEEEAIELSLQPCSRCISRTKKVTPLK
ncbi:unnamed protein product [Symbiodinium sp. CCMP2592]|nr:unnamed protein product [Symbiodinium sp. CCMP2592]